MKGFWVRFPERTPIIKEAIVEYYVQCKLRKGEATKIVWIPEHAAKKGNLVELKNDNFNEGKFWAVEQTFSKEERSELKENDFFDFLDVFYNVE